MANAKQYIEKIPQIEGTSVTEGDYKGHPTKFGVSAALVKDATGKTVSDDFIRNASFNDSTIQATIKFVWDSVMGNAITSQAVAELVVDHAYNAGRNRAICHLQNFLIHKFKADITADGKMGYKTLAALNVAIEQYGEALVYRSFRWLRANYYNGVPMTKYGTCNYYEGCKAAACKGLIHSRLDVYFPVNLVGQPTFNDNPELPLSKGLSKTAINTATVSAATSDNWLVIALVIVAIGVAFFYFKGKL